MGVIMFEFTEIFTIRKIESLSYRGRKQSMAVLIMLCG